MSLSRETAAALGIAWARGAGYPRVYRATKADLLAWYRLNQIEILTSAPAVGLNRPRIAPLLQPGWQILLLLIEVVLMEFGAVGVVRLATTETIAHSSALRSKQTREFAFEGV